MEHFQGWIRRLVDRGSGWEVAPPVPGQPSAMNWAEGLANYSDLQLGGDGALYLCHLHGEAVTPQGVFRIAMGDPTDVPAPGGVARPAVVVAPNPGLAGSGTSFRWEALLPGRHTLRIFDGLGREVGTRAMNVASRGEARMQWNGRSAAGVPLASGVYFYRIEDPAGGVLRGKLTTVR